ncbi:MAG: hypothetical protein IPH78_07055 [Bacteroidetes bacterium]|nr:hypothetical protein [Bacteroidota bacterium]
MPTEFAARTALKLNHFEVESKAVGSVRSEVMNLQTVLPDFSMRSSF